MLELPLLKLRDLGVAADQLLDSELAGRDISLAEARILAVCEENPECTAVEISGIIPVDTPTISRLVHRMVQRGLLSRRRSQADRRMVMLSITEDGKTAIAECLPLFLEAQRRFMQALSRERERDFRLSVETLLDANSP